jgi:hypothetical protein
MTSWKDDLVEALTALDGQGSLAEIYVEVTRRRPNLRGQWQATVRGTLERHSSDSENFKGEDLFYSVGGIGSGSWGLRSRLRMRPNPGQS